MGWFVHPVLRAIVAHFWLAWVHPFSDGNGRTARALFYWVMLKNGYWLTEYLPISRQLTKAPGQYARAFLFVESDELDLTYFIHHHLDVLVKTVDEAMAYMARKMGEARQAEELLRARGVLNHRQLALMHHAMTHDAAEYTFASHQRSHGVSYPTARTDLLALMDLGLLTCWKRGRTMVFSPVADLRVVLGQL